MPKYDYRCDKCNVTKMRELPIAHHDLKIFCECGEQMNKVFTPPAIHFKGGGWGGNHGQVR